MIPKAFKSDVVKKEKEVEKIDYKTAFSRYKDLQDLRKKRVSNEDQKKYLDKKIGEITEKERVLAHDIFYEAAGNTFLSVQQVLTFYNTYQNRFAEADSFEKHLLKYAKKNCVEETHSNLHVIQGHMTGDGHIVLCPHPKTCNTHVSANGHLLKFKIDFTGSGIEVE